VNFVRFWVAARAKRGMMQIPSHFARLAEI
jgi:hypothetical protein